MRSKLKKLVNNLAELDTNLDGHPEEIIPADDTQLKRIEKLIISRRIFMGIDPGIANGAIAIIDSDKNILYNANLPTTDKQVKRISKKTGKSVNRKMAELDMYALRAHMLNYNVTAITVIIEKVHAMNTVGEKQGISSSGRFMKACGLLEGLFIGMGVKVELISPQAWKKSLGLLKKEKEDSLKLAEEIFDVKFKYKYMHNQAESLLIAYYGMKNL